MNIVIMISNILPRLKHQHTVSNDNILKQTLHVFIIRTNSSFFFFYYTRKRNGCMYWARMYWARGSIMTWKSLVTETGPAAVCFCLQCTNASCKEPAQRPRPRLCGSDCTLYIPSTIQEKGKHRVPVSIIHRHTEGTGEQRCFQCYQLLNIWLIYLTMLLHWQTAEKQTWCLKTGRAGKQPLVHFRDQDILI